MYDDKPVHSWAEIFKALYFVPSFSKLKTRQSGLSGDFYKETNPGASSLILIRGLIYRHCGGSRWDFTGIWVQFYWTVFRSFMKQAMKKISLSLTVSKEYHNTVDHRLKAVSMYSSMNTTVTTVVHFKIRYQDNVTLFEHWQTKNDSKISVAFIKGRLLLLIFRSLFLFLDTKVALHDSQLSSLIPDLSAALLFNHFLK